MWHPVIRALESDVEVLAPDRPGYGHNPLEGGGVGENVEWLAGLVDHQPAIVVAHSWAGSVALAFAARYPERTRGLVLVGSVGPGAVTRTDRLLARPVLGPLATRPVFWAAHPVVRRTVSRTREPDTRQALLTAIDASRARSVWRTFLVEQHALVDELPAVLDGLSAVTTPTAVLAGTRDRVVPFRTAKALAAGLPTAELIPVARGGHQLHRTHPQVIADAVHRVLDSSAHR